VNDEEQPGVELDYGVSETGAVHAAMIIRDAARLRRAVSATMQWIPTVMADRDDDGDLVKYPGFDKLVELEKEHPEKVNMIPALVISHVPGHRAMEDDDEVEHQVYLITPEICSHMVNTGIAMFTDVDTATQIAHLLFHLMGGTHDDEDDHDCNP
jgi:hypothetical protein